MISPYAFVDIGGMICLVGAPITGIMTLRRFQNKQPWKETGKACLSLTVSLLVLGAIGATHQKNVADKQALVAAHDEQVAQCVSNAFSMSSCETFKKLNGDEHPFMDCIPEMQAATHTCEAQLAAQPLSDNSEQ